jgi:hypothetical protein
MPRRCRCGNEIPEHNGAGRPRTKCPECSPARNRPRIAAIPARPAFPDHPYVAKVREELGDLADTADGMALLMLAEVFAQGGGTQAGLVTLHRRITETVSALLADRTEGEGGDVVSGLFGT